MLRSAAIVLAGVVLTGCAESMAFVKDDRIMFDTPTDLERVTAPFEISWTDDGPEPDAYAVFVDSNPMAPDSVLSELADDACEGRSGCELEDYLTANRIYVTEEPAVEIFTLAPLGGVGGKSPERVHRATIVLLDDDGRRIGESSWSVEFREAGA